MTREEISALLSILGTSVIIGIYWRSVLKQGVKPHPFSWFLWGMLDVVTSAAQIEAGAGIGGWVTAFCGITCLGVAGLSLRRGEKKITHSDWFMFALGLAALPLWLWTDDPLAAVALTTFVNVNGYGPTFRKAFAAPSEENAFVFTLGFFEGLFMIGAIEQRSFTTLVFPVSTWLCNMGLVLMLLLRRHQLNKG